MSPFYCFYCERGGYEQYRDALLDFNQLWELGQQGPWMFALHDRSSRMLNQVRLSRLESRQGSPAAARRYIDLALDDCAAMERQRFECMLETLLEILEVLEEIQLDKQRTRFRRDKEADDTSRIGPGKITSAA